MNSDASPHGLPSGSLNPACFIPAMLVTSWAATCRSISAVRTVSMSAKIGGSLMCRHIWDCVWDPGLIPPEYRPRYAENDSSSDRPTPGGARWDNRSGSQSEGKFLPITDRTLQAGCFVWSPDDGTLACQARDDKHSGRNGVYTLSATDGIDLKRLTTNPLVPGQDLPGAYSTPVGTRTAEVRSQLLCPGVFVGYAVECG